MAIHPDDTGVTRTENRINASYSRTVSVEVTSVAKFQQVHTILDENHYDVMMVDRGARKVCAIQTCQWTGLEV